MINDYFIKIRKEAEPETSKVFPSQLEDLNLLIQKFIDASEGELLQSTNDEGSILLDVYFSAQNWLRISKFFDERFILYAEISRNNIIIKQFCLDPSYLIKQAGKHFKGKIFFSATLSPWEYYKNMLGWENGNYAVIIPSPFSEEQTDVFIQPISTRYHDRSKSVKPIVNTLKNTVLSKPGNYLIFFPSYQYLNTVLEDWQGQEYQIHTIVQEIGMADEERITFLDKFKPDSEKSLIGFAVLGGVFSEGVDLIGDRLTGVLIVGVGLPQIGFERDLIKQHFLSHGKNGYDYAYVYPGMNKVLQAGGRLIRSETDTGSIILIDDRYLQQKYQRLLPKEWRSFKKL